MGFWDVAGKVAKGVGSVALSAGKLACNAAIDHANKINRYRNEMADMSDKNVIRRFDNSSGTEKIVAAEELKKRGLM